MDKDAELLRKVSSSSGPLLHLYEWEGNCLTYGYFTDPLQLLHADALATYDLAMARRPTGGGILFHLTDLAFSVVIPAHDPHYSLNTLDNYAFVNRRVANALMNLSGRRLLPELLQNCTAGGCSSFCMAKPTQYDLIIDGKKIGGAAQRRTKQGFLHQGSISLALPPITLLADVLKGGKDVVAAMRASSYSLLDGAWTAQQLASLRYELEGLLIEHVTVS